MNVRHAFDTSRFEASENEKRLAIAEAIKVEAEALSLEYQRNMSRLTIRLGNETGVRVTDFHETIDQQLDAIMTDTFGWAVSRLEEE